MSSNKSTETQARTALVPQRRAGQERVAALLQAAAEVIAEKGYDAATMAEIAERAGAQIGSLYRFFPNKDVLANALVERFRARIAGAFDIIESKIAILSPGAFADALLDLLANLHGETQPIVALLEARSEWSARRLEFRRELRRRVTRTLLLRCPALRKNHAEDIAAVLLQNMKSMTVLTRELGDGVRLGALAELRIMTRQYLAMKFGESLGQ
jgi:AcrR family transcriptional regulator